MKRGLCMAKYVPRKPNNHNLMCVSHILSYTWVDCLCVQEMSLPTYNTHLSNVIIVKLSEALCSSNFNGRSWNEICLCCSFVGLIQYVNECGACVHSSGSVISLNSPIHYNICRMGLVCVSLHVTLICRPVRLSGNAHSLGFMCSDPAFLHEDRGKWWSPPKVTGLFVSVSSLYV
jgi:hypothetical protein